MRAEELRLAEGEQIVEDVEGDGAHQRLTVREVAVERPDPQARRPGDVLHRRVRAIGDERLVADTVRRYAAAGTTDLLVSLRGDEAERKRTLALVTALREEV